MAKVDKVKQLPVIINIMEQALELVEVPEGHFFFGDDEDFSHITISKDAESIWLPKFFISRFPITVDQWQSFLLEANYEWAFQDQVSTVCLGGNYPITFVSWFDCKRFVQYLSDKTSKFYELPSEAQWGKACQGPNNNKYSWGDQENPLLLSDWEIQAKQRIPVGNHPNRVSGYGCSDMGGNIFEWCNETNATFQSEYLASVASLETSNKEYKVVRGGNLFTTGQSPCCKRKLFRAETRDQYTGFRVVLSP